MLKCWIAGLVSWVILHTILLYYCEKGAQSLDLSDRGIIAGQTSQDLRRVGLFHIPCLSISVDILG